MIGRQTTDGFQVQGRADPAEDQGYHTRLGKGDEEETAATAPRRRRLHGPHGDEHRVLSHRRGGGRHPRGHATSQQAVPEDGAAAAERRRQHHTRDAPAAGLGPDAGAIVAVQPARPRDAVGVNAGHSFPEDDRHSDTSERRVGANMTLCCVAFILGGRVKIEPRTNVAAKYRTRF
jgi:hypothetical protein